ncbi:hypothetical protein D3C72_1419340 [compost metagenome]
MGGMIVIIADAKTGEILLVLLAHLRNHFFRLDAQLLSFQHDWRAVRVVRTDEMNLVAAHSLVTNPDICLDMLEHVAEMDGTICVR